MPDDFSRNTEILDATGFSGDGSLMYFQTVIQKERSSDPDDPPEGYSAVWQGDGTGSGDDGDILIKITTAGTTHTLALSPVGAAALATDATDGFLYIPSCAGAPTGTPTGRAGRLALVYDSSNNNLYVYNTAWKKVTLA